MTSRRVAIALGMLLFAAPMVAQSRGAKPDPLSGTWMGEFIVGDSGRARSVTMDLTFDGKGKVSGTFTGMPNPGDVKAGTFNSKTGALKLELGRQGDAAVLLVLEGTIAKGTATGRISGDATGEFKLTKKGK
jgi:hypothetical protein